MQGVVGVEACDPFAAGMCQAMVAGRRQAAVGFVEQDETAVVTDTQTADVGRIVGRAVVYQLCLEVAVFLGFQ